MAYGCLAFAAAVRVIYGVHNRAAYFRALTEVSRLTGFAEGYDFVFYVAHLTDRGTAS